MLLSASFHFTSTIPHAPHTNLDISGGRLQFLQFEEKDTTERTVDITDLHDTWRVVLFSVAHVHLRCRIAITKHAPLLLHIELADNG